MPSDQPATSLRLLRLGDSWDYLAAGSLTPPGAPPLPLAGTIRVTIERIPLAGRAAASAIAFAQSLTLATPDGGQAPFPMPGLTFWFEQDPDSRDVRILADTMTPDGAPRAAAQGQVFYPGTWSASTAYDNILEFPADRVRNTLTIQRAEIVEAPLGRFAAWYGPITSESAATGRIDGADWWTPELGAPIRFETRARLPDGALMTLRAEMTATNVLAR